MTKIQNVHDKPDVAFKTILMTFLKFSSCQLVVVTDPYTVLYVSLLTRLHLISLSLSFWALNDIGLLPLYEKCVLFLCYTYSHTHTHMHTHTHTHTHTIPSCCKHKGWIEVRVGLLVGFCVTKTNQCNVTHNEKDWVGGSQEQLHSCYL